MAFAQSSMESFYSSDPVFRMAVKQFEVLADHLEIPPQYRQRLIQPKRSVTVSLPVEHDDGRVEVYQGYRVQHHLSIGPTKGGTRFRRILRSANRRPSPFG